MDKLQRGYKGGSGQVYLLGLGSQEKFCSVGDSWVEYQKMGGCFPDP